MSSTFNQYFSSRPKISIIMPSSKRISFSGGIYVTDKKDEIEFLDKEISLGHPMIYIKKGEETITSEQLDPLHAIKQKAKEEAIAELTAKGSTGMMTSQGVSNSAESNAGAPTPVAAKLAGLKK